MSAGRRWLIGIGVAIVLLVGLPLLLLAIAAGSGVMKQMYTPSEGMAPTLLVGDHFFVSLDGSGDLHRGDLIVFHAPGGGEYVKRVAALPGDRIAVRDGIVILNGGPVAQRLLGTDPVTPPDAFGPTIRRLEEQFLGEGESHQIYDAGTSPGDDFQEVQMPPGRIFVLGDNRDHSADSRYPVSELGVSLLSIDAVEGHVLRFSWCTSRNCIGQRVH